MRETDLGAVDQTVPRTLKDGQDIMIGRTAGQSDSHSSSLFTYSRISFCNADMVRMQDQMGRSCVSLGNWIPVFPVSDGGK